jgi:hypothetical protein
MLTHLEIKNFRSCAHVQVRLGQPVIAFLGRNGAGKTNILHAIQLAASLCLGDAEPPFGLTPRDPKQPVSFRLKFTVSDSEEYEYETLRSASPTTPEIFNESLRCGSSELFSRRGEETIVPNTDLPPGLRIGTRSATLFALLQLLPETEARKQLRLVEEYLRSIAYYSLIQGFQEHVTGPQFRGPAAEDYPFIEKSRYERWKAEFSQGRGKRSVTMRLLHLHLTDKERFSELKRLVGPDGLGLLSDIRIHEFPVRALAEKTEGATADTAYAISFIPAAGVAGAGRPFRYTGLSTGTWRILQLLTYLIFDKNTCMLLEQPEDCIHPGLLDQVIDILQSYSKNTQLICTTHSPSTINSVGPSGIRLVTVENDKTVVSELNSETIAAAEKYLHNNGTLSEFLDIL